MQMLEQAVHELKGEPVAEDVEPNLQLQVSAYIPEEYVVDAAQRLSLYKRLTSSTQTGDLAQLHGELVDRYGAAPEPVERLFEVMEIRLLAKALSLTAIQARHKAVAFSFAEKGPPPQAGLQALMDQHRGRLRFTTPASFELLGVDPAWKTVFPEVKRVLQVLAAYDKNRPLAAS